MGLVDVKGNLIYGRCRDGFLLYWRGEAVQTYIKLEKAIPYISWARAIVDFLLPLVVGGVGLYLLISGSRNAL